LETGDFIVDFDTGHFFSLSFFMVSDSSAVQCRLCCYPTPNPHHHRHSLCQYVLSSSSSFALIPILKMCQQPGHIALLLLSLCLLAVVEGRDSDWLCENGSGSLSKVEMLSSSSRTRFSLQIPLSLPQRPGRARYAAISFSLW
jgi:hypothetical protein